MSAYATITEANAYFSERLHSGLWDTTTVGERLKALAQATRIIDGLQFAGEKAAAYAARVADPCDEDAILAEGLTQELQFPRGTDSTVPVDIKIASYELAFSLIDGKDPEFEFENLGLVSQGYSSVRATYNRSYAQEHLLAGVPSATAWRYLRKYLADRSEIKVSRV